MQHDGGAEAGADISRAGGQVAETLVIRERQRRFDERSYTVCGFETFLRAKAGADDLMIACCGYYEFKKGNIADLSLNAAPALKL